MTEGTGSLRGRLRRVSLAVPLLLAAAAVLGALAPAASAAGPAGASVGEPPASLSATPSARGARGLASDWVHVCQVADWLRYRTPPRRIVYVLGGSASRECVTDESAWSSDLRRRLGGKPAAGYVMSSSCQTFIEDARIINALPRGRGVAVIMIGLTRFYTVHINATLSTTAVRTTPPGPWYQHHYDSRAPLPLDEKRALVANWRTRHLAGFTDYYPQTLKDLDAVVQACIDRGIRPVFVEMPANLAAIQSDFDDVRAIYQEGCRTLAEEHDVAYLDFNASLKLRARDFYDLWHLLPAGRALWQDKLSRQLVSRGLL